MGVAALVVIGIIVLAITAVAVWGAVDNLRRVFQLIWHKLTRENGGA